MNAIVLTYDKYRSLTDHMIYKYSQVWPDHPFIFKVPYQSYPYDLKEKYGEKIELIESASDFTKTVLNLLEGLDDNEWVYWCIDDKYPLSLNLNEVKMIYNWLISCDPKEISGIMFCVKRNMLKRKRLSKKRSVKIPSTTLKMYRRINYDYIWMHQFLRVKVLKYIFLNFPGDISVAKSMDMLLKKLTLPEDHQLYTLTRSLGVFGESTHRGMITANCYESFMDLGFEIPDHFSITSKKILMGSVQYDESYILWKIKDLLGS